ncbi:hypothetical protein A3Q56_00082 [Intoshia linei]|uniref:Uncharacterized protein n=1 Tax=Intoshia linei TaxID=1819745 RepID=A0A177BEZ2_9BILA|nr:hypothetical protein A3Q56_00082 [Intoshia linei]
MKEKDEIKQFDFRIIPPQYLPTICNNNKKNNLYFAALLVIIIGILCLIPGSFLYFFYGDSNESLELEGLVLLIISASLIFLSMLLFTINCLILCKSDS